MEKLRFLVPLFTREEVLLKLGLETEDKIKGFGELSKKGSEIFNWFLRTPLLAELHRELASKSYEYHPESAEGHTLHGYFVNAVFENIAFSYMLANFKDGNFLSPAETLAKYTKMFPYNRIIKHAFGNRGIDLVSLPDGAVFDDHGRIKSIFEYSLHAYEERMQKKILAFNADRKKFSQQFSDKPTLAFVSSRDEISTGINNHENVELVNLPFSSEEFGVFIDKIICDYPPAKDDVATISDIRNKIRKQQAIKKE